MAERLSVDTTTQPLTNMKAAVGFTTLLAVTLAAALAPIPPAIVERVYSAGVYPLIQRLLTTGSNAVPMTLLDATGAMVVVAWLGLAARDFARDRPIRAAGRVARRGAAWAAVAYLAFLIVWGFYYRRVRLTARLPFEASAVTDAGAARLGAQAVARVNALHAGAHQEGWPAGETVPSSLAGAFERTARDLGAAHVVVARPKLSVLDWYFRRAG